MRYAFWNNKGGTGKTSLAFQAICELARREQSKKLLVIDVCPQANLSELFLGSLSGRGGENLFRIQGGHIRKTIGGYFQLRLPSPYTIPDFSPFDYIFTPSEFHDKIPSNVQLLAGDPLLELQANAMSTLANVTSPGTNTWYSVINWINDFLVRLENEFDYVFFDLNPSFSLYTQIALAGSDRVVLPVMADDSSRRAIQNAISLMYGLRLPSEIYAQHSFSARLKEAGHELPKVHLLIKNRLTQYMGPASGYGAVLRSIDKDIEDLLKSNSDIFSFDQNGEGATVDVRDFQTTGVVAFARGLPFYELSAKTYQIFDRRVQVNADQIMKSKGAIEAVVDRLI